MVNRSASILVVTLHALACVSCVKGKGPTRAPEPPLTFDEAMVVLREHDQSSYTASQTVMDAARLVFWENADRMMGLTKQELASLLGEPVKRAPAWEYVYHNGESGIIPQIAFDNDTGKVAEIRFQPTQ